MRVLCGPESGALMRGTAHPRRPSGFPPCPCMLRGVRAIPAAPAPLRAPAVCELLGCPPFGRCLAGFWETLRGLPGPSRASWVAARVRGACLFFAPFRRLFSSLPLSHGALPLLASCLLVPCLFSQYCLLPLLRLLLLPASRPVCPCLSLSVLTMCYWASMVSTPAI